MTAEGSSLRSELIIPPLISKHYLLIIINNTPINNQTLFIDIINNTPINNQTLFIDIITQWNFPLDSTHRLMSHPAHLQLFKRVFLNIRT